MNHFHLDLCRGKHLLLVGDGNPEGTLEWPNLSLFLVGLGCKVSICISAEERNFCLDEIDGTGGGYKRKSGERLCMTQKQ